MARCEHGYLCAVCGEEVEPITESELYLRYVLGEVDLDSLDRLPERHIRCNPAIAQFVMAEGFAPVALEGPFAKAQLAPDFVAAEERRVTRGYLRLRELAEANRPITDYPLPDVGARGQDLEGSHGV
jgi:hypothetical protein